MNIELGLYKKMYLIRACEEAIIKYYPENEMKTPMHMSMGSEHISSAVCLALGDRAQVFSSYRTHAPFLARTEDMDQFFLEMYGKKESVVGGRGGSMHLSYPDKGFILSSAIVASQISVACGFALANKMKGNNKIVVVFFGDGATEEGAFWESLNMAFLYKLPIIFVCEDNDLAVHTLKRERKSYLNFLEKVPNWFRFSLTEGDLIYSCIESILEYPLYLECVYHRMLEHVGIDEDYNVGYRVKPTCEIDPVKILREKLIPIFFKDIINIELAINEKVTKSLLNIRGHDYA